MRPLALALLLAPAVGSCTSATPSSPADAPPQCTLQLEWGRKESGSFVVFKDGDEAKITLGFQGFRFIDGVARIRGVDATSATFRMQTTLVGSEPKSQDGGPFEAKRGPDGALYVEGVLLFFNDVPLAELIGQTAAVVVVADAGGCRGSAHATVKLLRGGCMDRDGGASCEDGGT